MTKEEIGMKAFEIWTARAAAHHGYHDWSGRNQDDLSEMIDAEWTFTKANQKIWDTYNAYFEQGVIPYGMKKLKKKEIEKRLEDKMDKVVKEEFNRYFKKTYR